ncbi:MAG: pilus assembly protein PilM [Bryobacterales bacterium]
MASFATTLARLGSGLGIEIRGEDLRVVAVKSRSGGVSVLGATTIERFSERPAPEWGRELASFLRGLGMAHAAATVCLPRRDVIVRQIQLPPMPEKERQAAIRYQLDGLHPFSEDEIYWSGASIGKSPAKGAPTPVAVLIAERDRVDSYANLFEEAGVQVAGFTVSAAALYTALRVRWDEPPRPLLVAEIDGSLMEVYGESAGRPMLSAEMNLRTVDPTRALELAAADLRLDEGQSAALVVAGEPSDEAPPEFRNLEWKSAEELFPAPSGSPADFDLRTDLSVFSAALDSACPRLGLRLNLLPEERRKSDSRWRYAPTAALAAMLALLAVGFAVRPVVQDRKYAAALEQRIAALEAIAAETEAAHDEAERVRAKLAILGALSVRTQNDLRILSEVSDRLPTSAWLTSIEIDDDGARLVGEADAAAPLLEALNQSSSLAEAAFSTSLRKIEEGERFQIAAKRRAVTPAPVATPPPAVAQAGPAPAPEPAPAASGALSTVGEDQP